MTPMKRSLLIRSHALTSALALSCFGLLGNQSEAATLLDFDFNSDTVGAAAPSGWFDNRSGQSADLSVALDTNDWFGQGTGNKIVRYTETNTGDNGLGYTAFTPTAGDFYTITFDYYMAVAGSPDNALGNSDLNNSTRRNARYGGPDIVDSLVTVSMLVNESGSTKSYFNPETSMTVNLADGDYISFDYNHVTGVYDVDGAGTSVLSYSSVDKFAFKTGNADIQDFYFDDVVLHDNQLFVSPVPEPSSTALLGLGGLALILRRRRA